MTKLQLNKAAIDFAYTSSALSPIALAEASISTFKTAGGRDEDLQIWNQAVSQNVALVAMMTKQKLPSEVSDATKLAEAPAAPVSNAQAALVVQPETK